MNLDWLKNIPWPEECAKPTYIVADNLVEAAREVFGDRANVIAQSDTMLPLGSEPSDKT